MPLDRERRGPIFEFDNGDDDDDDESVTRSSDAEGVNFAFGVFPECLMQAFGEHRGPIFSNSAIYWFGDMRLEDA